MLLEPKPGVTYGPVHSRRLGRSLGINLLPTRRKLCTFDCLYCHYGWTAPDALERIAEQAFPPPELVSLEVAKALLSLEEPPAFVTFSGNGEPTLHPAFGAAVDGVIQVRNRLAPTAKTAILSNSSRVGDPLVRGALARLDMRIMKLDAGSEEAFRRFNRPPAGVSLSEIIAGLRLLGGVTLQSLFAAGPAGNTGAADVDAWLDAVQAVSPVEVQVYTLARGYPSRLIEPAPRERLEEIASLLHARGVQTIVF